MYTYEVERTHACPYNNESLCSPTSPKFLERDHYAEYSNAKQEIIPQGADILVQCIQSAKTYLNNTIQGKFSAIPESNISWMDLNDIIQLLKGKSARTFLSAIFIQHKKTPQCVLSI